MDHESLVKEQIDAGAKFLREFEKYAPVRVAFWLKERDRRFRHLYVVSDEITDDNFDRAYREVGRIQGQMRNPYLDFGSVMVRGVDDPMAKATLEKRRCYAAEYPIRLYDTYFGGVGAEEVYIYPLPVPEPVS
jgi:hypothetical protein